MYKTIILAFLAVVLLYALLVTFKQIKGNMPKESFEEPKLRICLFKAEWCGHCQKYVKSHVFEDTYASIKDDYPGVVFVTYDFDQNKKLAEQWNVNSFPSILAVGKDGKLLDTFEGDRYSPEDLVKFVKKNM
jgi:thiol-disulfide isomerase/thioredoxin